MFASGYNDDDLHDACRGGGMLQKLYDVNEFKAALAIALMQERQLRAGRGSTLVVSARVASCATERLA